MPAYFPKLLQHYARFDVQVEMTKQGKNREFGMLKKAWTGEESMRRTRICCNDKGLKFHIADNSMKEKQIPYIFYYSIATFKQGEGVPFRQVLWEDKVKWQETYADHIATYDFFMDIDAKDHKDIAMAYASAKDVKRFFDDLVVPYSLRFSGKGFHFIIPHHYFAHLNLPFDHHQDTTHNIYAFYQRIAKYLNETYSELIDMTIYDARRFCKIPYSYSCYEDSAYICWPFLDDAEFEAFTLKQYHIDHFNKKIAYRGIPLFNKEGNAEHLIQRFNP